MTQARNLSGLPSTALLLLMVVIFSSDIYLALKEHGEEKNNHIDIKCNSFKRTNINIISLEYLLSRKRRFDMY